MYISKPKYRFEKDKYVVHDVFQKTNLDFKTQICIFQKHKSRFQNANQWFGCMHFYKPVFVIENANTLRREINGWIVQVYLCFKTHTWISKHKSRFENANQWCSCMHFYKPVFVIENANTLRKEINGWIVQVYLCFKTHTRVSKHKRSTWICIAKRKLGFQNMDSCLQT